jgi:hypothetical protein
VYVGGDEGRNNGSATHWGLKPRATSRARAAARRCCTFLRRTTIAVTRSTAMATAAAATTAASVPLLTSAPPSDVNSHPTPQKVLSHPNGGSGARHVPPAHTAAPSPLPHAATAPYGASHTYAARMAVHDASCHSESHSSHPKKAQSSSPTPTLLSGAPDAQFVYVCGSPPVPTQPLKDRVGMCV